MHALSRACVLSFIVWASTPALADAKLKACMLIPDGTQRLACYDAALERDAAKILKVDEDRVNACGPVDDKLVLAALDPKKEIPPYCLRVTKDVHPTKRIERTPPQIPPATAAAPEAKDESWRGRWLRHGRIRATTDIASANESPAEYSSTHSAGRTSGSGKGAVILLQKGSLELFEWADQEPTTSWYGGLGFAYDKTNADPTQHTSTQNLRLGRFWLLDPQTATSALGHRSAADLALVIQADDTADTRIGSLEARFDWGRRWFRDDRFGRTVHEHVISATVGLFHDRILDDRGGKLVGQGPRSSSGGLVKLGATFKWPLQGLSDFAPDTYSVSGAYEAELDGRRREATDYSISLQWKRAGRSGSKQGLKIERTLGGSFRAGESKSPKTKVSFTYLLGK